MGRTQSPVFLWQSFSYCKIKLKLGPRETIGFRTAQTLQQATTTTFRVWCWRGWKCKEAVNKELKPYLMHTSYQKRIWLVENVNEWLHLFFTYGFCPEEAYQSFHKVSILRCSTRKSQYWYAVISENIHSTLFSTNILVLLCRMPLLDYCS